MNNCEKQGELGLIALLKGPAPLDEATVASFGDLEDTAVVYAVQWAWAHRRVRLMTKRKLCELTGIIPQHLPEIMRGTKYLPPAKINAFEWAVGNTAISQTLARFRLIRQQQMAAQLSTLIAETIVRAA